MYFRKDKQVSFPQWWGGPMKFTCLQVVDWSSWSMRSITPSGLVSAASKLNTQQWLGDPMHSSNLVITAISFMSPLNNHWAWKRRLSFIHKVVHFIQMILDIHSAKFITIFHPKSSLSSVLQSCSFHVLGQLTGQIISLEWWIITKDL